MDGQERREHIVKTLKKTLHPVKGAELGEKFSVSRQVIVQDIALIRAQGKRIISTPDGYMLLNIEPEMKVKRIHFEHDDGFIEKELEIVIDHGGKITGLGVLHPVYGDIHVKMNISSRRHIREFVEQCTYPGFVPLMRLTDGKHYHVIEAESEAVLDRITKEIEIKAAESLTQE